MHPLNLTNESFIKLKAEGHRVVIEYLGFKLYGRVTQVYPASNYPYDPGSFDFEMEPESKMKLEKAGYIAVRNFSVFDPTNIEIV